MLFFVFQFVLGDFGSCSPQYVLFLFLIYIIGRRSRLSPHILVVLSIKKKTLTFASDLKLVKNSNKTIWINEIFYLINFLVHLID